MRPICRCGHAVADHADAGCKAQTQYMQPSWPVPCTCPRTPADFGGAPLFDVLQTWEVEGVNHDVVLHRDPTGADIAWHSPLNDGAVKCSICESGARVYMNLGDEA